MKKILLGVFFMVIVSGFYLIYKEISFSPLKKNDFQKLFKRYTEGPKKICSKDFLGVSFHGELFEIYLYGTTNAIIDKTFPKINEWEQNKITDGTILGTWKNCPLDSLSMALYKFTLTSNNFDDVKCSKLFNKQILNPKNYFSYIYFNELEQYFLLYCTESQDLYYIRRKGF